jgi:hypothetical protein
MGDVVSEIGLLACGGASKEALWYPALWESAARAPDDEFGSDGILLVGPYPLLLASLTRLPKGTRGGVLDAG